MADEPRRPPVAGARLFGHPSATLASEVRGHGRRHAGGLRFELQQEPDAEVCRIVSDTLWRARGGMEYRYLDANRWRASHPQVAVVRTGSRQVVQVIVFHRTRWGAWLNTIITPTTAPALLPQVTRQAIATIRRALPGDGLVLSAVAHRDGRILRNLNGAGLRSLGTLESIPFSRQCPRASAACRRLPREALPWLVDALGGAMRDAPGAEQTPCARDYFVYCCDQKPVAGIQARPHTIQVVRQGAWARGWLPAAAPREPAASVHQVRMLELAWAWGDPKYYCELWSHVLAVHGAHFAQIVIDTTDPYHHEVRHRFQRGLAAALRGVERLSVCGTGPVPPTVSVAPMAGVQV